jgi:hypothetical protein
LQTASSFLKDQSRIQDDWNLMDEDRLSLVFWNDTTKSESNKEAFQEDMVNTR